MLLADVFTTFCVQTQNTQQWEAQTPPMRAPFTNALLLIDNGLTSNKQTPFEPLIIHNLSTSCGGWQKHAVK